MRARPEHESLHSNDKEFLFTRDNEKKKTDEDSMADVLEDERNLRQSDFRAQKVVMVVLELRVGIMIPPSFKLALANHRVKSQRMTYVLASP